MTLLYYQITQWKLKRSFPASKRQPTLISIGLHLKESNTKYLTVNCPGTTIKAINGNIERVRGVSRIFEKGRREAKSSEEREK